jgi:hypothetical protein
MKYDVQGKVWDVITNLVVSHGFDLCIKNIVALIPYLLEPSNLVIHPF